jgi:predicted AlkP superfamily pyrophosphatase or phosphodiesterase
MANIESTRWIFKAAAWLHERHRPNFHWIYVPHLDYAGQKFGPNSPQAKAALAELDRELGAFLDRVSGTTPGLSDQVLIAGEYAMTDVSGVVYPNRLLRQAGLLQVRTEGSGERLDLACSPAFALVDHQLAHVYVGSSGGAEGAKLVGQVRDLFTGMPGVAQVLAGADRHHVGLNHPRAGDVILISDDSHWFAYYWWLDDAAAPPFARTVDIHNKPGYDPVELFFDPATRGIPLDPRLVKGSHGVPATAARHHTALIGSTPRDLPAGACDVDLMQLCLDVVAG